LEFDADDSFSIADRYNLNPAFKGKGNDGESEFAIF